MSWTIARRWNTAGATRRTTSPHASLGLSMLRLFLAGALLCALATTAVAEIQPHPAGCPESGRSAGCGAAVKVPGHPRRDLWLARAWYRFPRTSPASGMVAVRRHPVFVLLSPRQRDDVAGGTQIRAGARLACITAASLVGPSSIPTAHGWRARNDGADHKPRHAPLWRLSRHSADACRMLD